ncbi:MAG: hypothetical protein ISR95_00185 [Candidatus Marinimicrobia bacterium]|nr:hypothetical protein [Candidatus Neomarinimicrobiota bacterium]MBL7046048.1 hypothetical protein [Candidatus Neomarinimicrobiota bacterium]
MESKFKHLEFIQGVINRVAHCSFLLKGWSVILLSGLFALAAKDKNILFVYLAYLPVLTFWVLDGFYLYQERLYRNLYNNVKDQQSDDIDFSMNTKEFIGINKATWCESIFSKTMLLFHLPIFITVCIVIIICI